MRAFAIRSFGEAPALHDLPIPAADGTFLIRVRYAGVNPLDNNNLARLTADSAYPYVLDIDRLAEKSPPRSSCRTPGLRLAGPVRVDDVVCVVACSCYLAELESAS